MPYPKIHILRSDGTEDLHDINTLFHNGVEDVVLERDESCVSIHHTLRILKQVCNGQVELVLVRRVDDRTMLRWPVNEIPDTGIVIPFKNTRYRISTVMDVISDTVDNSVSHDPDTAPSE